MFNSSSVTNRDAEKTFIPVIVTLVDGETIKGAIAIQKNSRLGDLLNSKDRYVLFKTNTGEPIYLSQSTIAAVQSNDKPSAKQLEISLKQMEDTNPYRIMKVDLGVDKPTLRNAYHELVKHYHPDQFANIDLPKEVHAYLESVIVRINAAYQELGEEIDREERLRKAQEAASKVPDLGKIHYFGQ